MTYSVDMTMPYPINMTAPVTLDELDVAAKAARSLAAGPTADIRFGVTEHWLTFRITEGGGTREFGIWRASGLIFEADETGAMGDEPVDIP